MALCIFKVLYSLLLLPFPGTFPTLWHLVKPLSTNLIVYGYLIKLDHTIFIILCLYNVFRDHPCCHMYQSFINFKAWIIFHACLYHVLFVCSTLDGYLGCSTYCLCEWCSCEHWYHEYCLGVPLDVCNCWIYGNCFSLLAFWCSRIR